MSPKTQPRRPAAPRLHQTALCPTVPLAWLGWMLAACLAFGAAPAAASPLELERFTLPNGLRLVLNPTPGSAVVSTSLAYEAGSAVEAPGQTGLAELMGRLMFDGTRNLEQGEYQTRIHGLGGSAGTRVSKDLVEFYATVPQNALEVVLWLEADRMSNLALNREAFGRERSAMLDELNGPRSDTDRVAPGVTRLQELAYQGLFAYQHPTFGVPLDVESADYGQLRRWHAELYRPDNAVLAISGDFDPAEARRQVTHHFGDASARGQKLRRAEFKSLPRQTTERLNVIEDQTARYPAVLYGWLIPPAGTVEHRALELAGELLTGGSSARLTRAQVYEKASAQAVSSWTDQTRGVDLFAIQELVSSLSSVDRNQRWLDEALVTLRTQGPSPDEVAKAKSQLRRRWLWQLETSRQRAQALARFELLWGNAELVNQQLDAYDEITPQQIRSAAATYLLPHRRSIVEIYPPGYTRDIAPDVVTQTHVVKAGENLTVIARRYGTSVAALTKANRLKSKQAIFPGQKLFVTLGPKDRRITTKTYTVKKGDTLSGIAKKHGVTVAHLTKENGISRKRSIRPGQQLTITIAPAATTKEKGSKRKGK